MLTRPRVGFKPTRPQAAAGSRIDPPPSLPCAIATIPEATAAHDPPLDPAGVLFVSHGLRVGPHASGSVVATAPNSGELVRPKLINPAARIRRASSVVTLAMYWLFFKNREPCESGSPAVVQR